jgi:glycosyltransferase involved in cell wall biosynthesis
MIRSANLTGSVSRNAGGLFESVRRLVQSLQQGGMEVCVFGSEDDHTAEDIQAWAPVPVKAYRPLGPKQFGYSPRYHQALMEFSPDLVHTHGLWGFSSIATNQYRRTRGIPYVISAHGMLDPWAVHNSRWKKAIAHFFYEDAHLREASCLRALCEAEARAIRQFGLKNPIAIIPNGIDLPEAGSPPSAVSISKSEGRKTLLFLGRLHPKKGLVNLLRAWAAATRKPEIGNRKSTEWLLAIAGWDQGGHESELKRLCDELGIAWQDARNRRTADGEEESRKRGPSLDLSAFEDSSVVFLGPAFGEDKAALYRSCDAFILPSLSEGLPMVVLEAWAHGKPVLMTPECNLPEGFAANAAIRIETGVESITQGLRELFDSSPSTLRALGDNGHRLVAEKFTWPVLGREMTNLYEWMLGGNVPPACLVDF